MSEPLTGVSGLVIHPGREVHLVIILLEKDAPLSKLLSGIACCSEPGVELLDLWTTRGELATIILASVSPRAEGGVEAFVSCVEKIDGVRAVDRAPGVAKGFAVESWGFPVLPGSARALVIDASLLGSMLREGWKFLGRALQPPLYASSFAYGQELAGKLRNLGLEGESLLYTASEVLRHMGFGVIFWESLTESRAVATVHGSVECSAMTGVPGYESSIIRGLVAGIVGGLWGVDRGSIVARETSCIARGDKACRIEVALRQK